jgi:hypothetical protein
VSPVLGVEVPSRGRPRVSEDPAQGFDRAAGVETDHGFIEAEKVMIIAGPVGQDFGQDGRLRAGDVAHSPPARHYRRFCEYPGEWRSCNAGASGRALEAGSDLVVLGPRLDGYYA